MADNQAQKNTAPESNDAQGAKKSDTHQTDNKNMSEANKSSENAKKSS